MSDDTESRNISLTMSIDELLRDGININTGEDVIITVTDPPESISE